MSLSAHRLIDWFLQHRRQLPWRQKPSPYAVWVSEVMLQQTQVAVVIPYFCRWMERWPTVKALAEAELPEVIKAWEGLGYYSRARNLHAGAQQICREYNGEIPRDPEVLSAIRGIGPYTVGAIRSFAFRERAAVVDGNVARVLARLWRVEAPIDRPATQRAMREMLLEKLPADRHWLASEALIELGATVCKRTPGCEGCPLKGDCRAFAEGMVAEYPKRTPRRQSVQLHRTVHILLCGESTLLRLTPEREVMAGLYTFPYSERESECVDFLTGFDRVGELALRQHSFTHHVATLYPQVYCGAHRIHLPNCEWVSIAELEQLPLCSGHRQIANELMRITAEKYNESSETSYSAH